MKNIVVTLSVIFLFPASALSQSSVDPHLQLFERHRLSIELLWLETQNEEVEEMNYAFAFESIKAKPSASSIIQVHPEDKPSKEQWIEVVSVLDSDCSLSSFWEKVCRDVQEARVIDNPLTHRQMLILRDIPKADDRRGLELVRAMVFLGETPDFQCLGNATEKEARRLEHAAKNAEAKRLTSDLRRILRK